MVSTAGEDAGRQMRQRITRKVGGCYDSNENEQYNMA